MRIQSLNASELKLARTHTQQASTGKCELGFWQELGLDVKPEHDFTEDVTVNGHRASMSASYVSGLSFALSRPRERNLSEASWVQVHFFKFGTRTHLASNVNRVHFVNQSHCDLRKKHIFGCNARTLAAIMKQFQANVQLDEVMMPWHFIPKRSRVKWPILTAITQQRAGLCPYFIFGLIRNWWKFFTQFTAQVADRSSVSWLKMCRIFCHGYNVELLLTRLVNTCYLFLSVT